MTIQRVRFLVCTLGLGLGLAAAARPVGAEAASEWTAEDIVAASVEASGGKAMDSVHAVRRTADMHIESDLFGVLDGAWEIAFHPGRKGFQRSDLGGDVTSIGWDGAVGWEQTAMGQRELNSAEIGLNRWQWELSFLHALDRDSGVGDLTRVDDEAIGDVVHYVLQYTDGQGAETRIYVDSATSLISRLATEIDLPPLGLCAVTTDYSDYRDVDGLMLPGASKNVIENLWVVRADFRETEINPVLPESLFLRPSGS